MITTVYDTNIQFLNMAPICTNDFNDSWISSFHMLPRLHCKAFECYRGAWRCRTGAGQRRHWENSAPAPEGQGREMTGDLVTSPSFRMGWVCPKVGPNLSKASWICVFWPRLFVQLHSQELQRRCGNQSNWMASLQVALACYTTSVQKHLVSI